MAMQVKIELNQEGIRELLKSEEVQKDLGRRGDAVVQRAGPEDHESTVWLGFDRARCTVRTTTSKGAKNESENKTLTSSIDAARG